MTLKSIEELLEEEFAKAAGLSPKEHKCVLGDKQKYITAALKAHNAVIREMLKDAGELFGNLPFPAALQALRQKYIGGE